MSVKLIAFIIAGLSAVPVAAVQFDPLPAIDSYQRSSFGEFAQTTYHGGLGETTSAGGRASAVFAPNAQVSLNGSIGYRFTTELTYRFRLDGPADMVVPLIAYTTIALSKTSAYGHIYAGLDIGDGVNAIYDKFLLIDESEITITSFTGGIHFNGHTGATGDIHLFADSIGGDSTAFVDPYLVIDPAFAAIDPNYASTYRFAFSDGASNVPVGGPAAVPEPASWAMLIVGFGIIGLATRRRAPAIAA